MLELLRSAQPGERNYLDQSRGEPLLGWARCGQFAQLGSAVEQDERAINSQDPSIGEAHSLDGRSTVGAMQIDKSHFTVKRVCRVVPELVCIYRTPSTSPFCFQKALFVSMVLPAHASSLIFSDWVVWLCSCTRTACGWPTTLARRCETPEFPQAHSFVIL